MKKSTCFASICMGLILFSLLVTPPAYSASAKDPLMELLPDSTLFCVRVNNFTTSLGLLDQYLAGASPMPLSMSVNMILGGALGDNMMNGVNKYGTFALVGLMPDGQSEPTAAFLLPITDLQPFTSNPNCEGPDENGLYLLDAPNSPIGALSFVPIANASYLLVEPASEKEVLQAVRTGLDKKKKSLADRINSMDAKNASSAPAWAWLNIETGYAMAAPLIRQGFEEGMKQGMEQSAIPTNAQNMTALLDAFDKWMQQADSLSLILTPTATLLTAETNLSAKADSELAKLLVRDPAMKSGFTMGGYLNSEAPISGLMNMNKTLWGTLNQGFLEAFMMGMGTENNPPDLMTKFKAMMDKSMQALGSEIAFSFAYRAGMPPFSMQEAVAVNDAKTMREMLQNSSALVTEIYSNIGMPTEFSFKEGVETYKGVSIDRGTFKITLPEDAPEPQKAAMEAMYGKEGMSYPFAITEKAMFVTMGPGAEDALKKMIDKKDNLPPMPADMQTAMQIIPKAESADFILSINAIKAMKGFSEMMTSMPQTMPQGADMPPFAKLLEGIPMNTQSSMAIGTHIDGGRVRTTIALPKQHLMEIVGVTMQIQQKIMMQQMQQQMQQQQQEQEQMQSAPDSSASMP